MFLRLWKCGLFNCSADPHQHKQSCTIFDKNTAIYTCTALQNGMVVMQLIEAFHNAAQTVTDLRNNNEHLIRYFEYMDLAENTKEEQQEQVPLQC